ncbi:hypothetical protein LZK98_11620 [Sphingomonas cannabina]|uniref:hypothetical protein n=1 Tax=Sphingomonas cannabina TaxID=2899123 RepID=UPI001F372CA2|nr:hypothetical protein [Sphingomonas cannabina]UIJ43739.1 hypothetical protein LZK98_11620 [Sphingomonas cannabina]
MTLALLSRYWRELGLAFLAVIICGMVLLDARHASQRDKARAELAAEQARHAVTRQSVETLTAALDVKNRESEARAKAYEESKAANAKAIAELDQRYKATASRVEALRAMAKQFPANPACRAPAALLAQLEGL